MQRRYQHAGKYMGGIWAVYGRYMGGIWAVPTLGIWCKDKSEKVVRCSSARRAGQLGGTSSLPSRAIDLS
eukprot:5894341-Prymnesium_polylepis.2